MILFEKVRWRSGISPEEASKLENLQILPWKQNLLKR